MLWSWSESYVYGYYYSSLLFKIEFYWVKDVNLFYKWSFWVDNYEFCYYKVYI